MFGCGSLVVCCGFSAAAQHGPAGPSVPGSGMSHSAGRFGKAAADAGAGELICQVSRVLSSGSSGLGVCSWPGDSVSGCKAVFECYKFFQHPSREAGLELINFEWAERKCAAHRSFEAGVLKVLILVEGGPGWHEHVHN